VVRGGAVQAGGPLVLEVSVVDVERELAAVRAARERLKAAAGAELARAGELDDVEAVEVEILRGLDGAASAVLLRAELGGRAGGRRVWRLGLELGAEVESVEAEA
jgi:hypothetical protein